MIKIALSNGDALRTSDVLVFGLASGSHSFVERFRCRTTNSAPSPGQEIGDGTIGKLPKGADLLAVSPSDDDLRSSRGHSTGLLLTAGVSDCNSCFRKVGIPLPFGVSLVDFETTEVAIL